MSYVPTPLLPSSHAMTIVSALSDHVRRPAPVEAEQRHFRTDPETEVVAWCSWQPNRFEHPTVIVLHGLTGHADAAYVRATAAKAYRSGFNAVRLNARNCGDTEALTPTLYHSGLTTDLAAVVETLVTGDGLENVSAIGFSMGGNVVLKHAGEQGSACRLRSIVAVSPPVELALASAAIDRGWFNGIYQLSFLGSLSAMVRRKAALFPDRYDVSLLRGAKSLRAFDDRFIAPCFGFDDADDYYFRASAGRTLDAITIPTLVVHARNDSFVPAEPIESWRARAARNVTFTLTDHGGHVGFLSSRRGRQRDPDCFWAENRAVEFVARYADGT